MLQIVETWKSGEGDTGREGNDTYIAFVTGDVVADNADDPQTVMQFAIPHFGQISWAGNALVNFARERLAPGWWMITAKYVNPYQTPPTNAALFTFTTNGGTQHITCSRRTVQAYGAVQLNSDGNPLPQQTPPPNYQGSINVGDNDVAGTDIPVATFDFKITVYLPPGNTANAYFNTIRSIGGAVFNSDTVAVNVDGLTFTFQPGELLFLCCDGSKRRGFGDFEFQLQFKSSANISNLTLGPIQGIAARGWDYVWVHHKAQETNPNTASPTASNLSNVIAHLPDAVYVEEVLGSAALSPLLAPIGFSGGTPPWQSSPFQLTGVGTPLIT